MNGSAPVIPWSVDEFFSRHGVVPAQDTDRRRFARKYFRRPTTAVLSTTLPAFARATEEIIVYSCDLSLSGVGFIIDRQIYPGERVQLAVPAIGTKEVLVQRCYRLADRCYCVGGTFDTPLPPAACRHL